MAVFGWEDGVCGLRSLCSFLVFMAGFLSCNSILDAWAGVSVYCRRLSSLTRSVANLAVAPILGHGLDHRSSMNEQTRKVLFHSFGRSIPGFVKESCRSMKLFVTWDMDYDKTMKKKNDV